MTDAVDTPDWYTSEAEALYGDLVVADLSDPETKSRLAARLNALSDDSAEAVLGALTVKFCDTGNRQDEDRIGDAWGLLDSGKQNCIDEKISTRIRNEAYVQPSWTTKDLWRGHTKDDDCPYKLATLVEGDRDFAADISNRFLKTLVARELLDDFLSVGLEDIERQRAGFAARFAALDPWDACEVWHEVMHACSQDDRCDMGRIKAVMRIVVDRVLEHLGHDKS